MSENNNAQYDRLDSNGLLYFLQRIKTIFQGMFVSKETGKGLSTNDYTTSEKQKLAGIETGAEENTLEGVKLGTTSLTPDANKIVTIPLDSALSNSSTNPVQNKPIKDALDLKAPLASPEFTGTPTVPTATAGTNTTQAASTAFVANALTSKAPLASPAFTGTPTVPTAAAGTNTTQAASTAFVKTAIENALSGKIDLQFSFLQALPASGVVGTFYFIPATNSITGVDEWEEYVWDATNSRFERIGAATLDLTGYFNTTNLPAITNAQIDTILAT